MKRKQQARASWLINWLFCALAAVIILAACTPNTSEFLISPQLGAQIALRDAGNEVAVIPTPTPRPIIEFSDEEKYAGLPDDILAEMPNVNTADAPAIYTKYACQGCHSLDPAVKLAGPNWNNAGNTAVTRKPDLSPGQYIYESITAPGAYVVESYVDGAMPKDFAQKMSKLELATMIKFLLEQHGP